MAASRHECSICMASFKNPKLIPCHHSFCYKCLEDYVQVNLHNGCFNCPICRTSIHLPESGISGFQTNFYIDTHSNEKFLCEICGAKYVEERVEKEREERQRKEWAEQEMALQEERVKKEREERVKKEREERQIKEWSQKIETRVKDLEREVSSTRKQYEEAKANAITIGANLNQTEKEIRALHIQHADAIAEVNRYKREIIETMTRLG